MISLSDHQLDVVTTAARGLSIEKRAVFLERVAAMLNMRRPFNDADVVDVVGLALCGLAHEAA